jgi:cyclophilin family peptidyl-prolyl cis-trans isomerase/HEAT repeat protein
VAGLLEVEDRRDFDPLAVGRASASLDPWVRSRAALACGRLRDVEASIYLPVLLGDPDPTVRRSAAFASGISGDRRLVPVLAGALGDPDRETAAEAAAALGRLGGAAAERALRGALSAAGPARAAAARALHRVPDPELVPLLAGVLADGDPEARRAAAWSLARSPRPGTEVTLRALLVDADPEVAAWAARGLGLLGDPGAVPLLGVLAGGAAPGPAIQAFVALDRLSAKGVAAGDGPGASPGDPAMAAAVPRVNDPHPGVATAARTLLRRFASDVVVRDLLATEAARGGRRGGVALASLAAGDPDRAFALAFPAHGAPVELRLGAAEAIPLLPADRVGRWLDALLADPGARVRMEAVSRIPKGVAAQHAGRLARALADTDGSVRAAALDAAAPLASGNAADAAVKEAWTRAYGSALASREADLVASALDAAASLPEGGCALLDACRDDPDDLARERARRLLVERCGADTATFVFRPVRSRLRRSDYERLARFAEKARVRATFATTRGTFAADLLPREAPMTVDSFVGLARDGFFDGTTVHRVVPDFVVQGGDPRGDGTGGPGYALRDELNPLPYVRGRIGMALSGPDTGGSQWFVALSRQPHLDGGYTVFGEVVAGMDVVERIEQDDLLLSVRVTEETTESPAGLSRESR